MDCQEVSTGHNSVSLPPSVALYHQQSSGNFAHLDAEYAQVFDDGDELKPRMSGQAHEFSRPGDRSTAVTNQ